MSKARTKEKDTESEFIERFEIKQAITAFILQSSSRKKRQKKKAVGLSALSTITPDHVDSRVMQQVS